MSPPRRSTTRSRLRSPYVVQPSSELLRWPCRGTPTSNCRSAKTHPTSLFLVTAAASSERKSSADGEALWPIRQYERNLRGLHDAEFPAYLNDVLAWEQARDAAVKRAKGDRAAIKGALDTLGRLPGHRSRRC